MLYRTIFIINTLFLLVRVSGQQVQVINASDRAPIEHVAIFNNSRSIAAITDSAGMVNLSIFHLDDTITFQHPSYNSVEYATGDISDQSFVVLHRKRIMIEEFVISASKSRESKLIIPYMVDVMGQNILFETTGATGAEILEGTGNVMVQKTQGGGGSPILRGFEANRILLVIDGVRMNNAIYRSGHLQNSITIDHSILERAEIVFGPASIMYGSDALGGVIHYYTRDPVLAADSLPPFDVRAYARYASAMKGMTGHLDFSVGGKKWGSLTSITYKDLGDIRIGARRSPYLGEWGQVMHTVEEVNGTDSTVVNEDLLIQKNTGYAQMDILQKVRFAPSRYVNWILNLQYSTSSDIDRLDMLNNYRGGNLEYASNYYGPQNRWFLSLKNVLRKDNRFFTNMTTIAAYQKIDEDRYSRKFRNPELLSQQEDVRVLSLNVDLLKVWDANHKFNYGVEFNHNTVESQAWYENIHTGERQQALTRYPEGGSWTWSTSAYASYKWIPGRKVVLTGGARYNQGVMASEFSNPLLPYDRIQISHGAVTGSVGLVYAPSDRWQLNAILSSGFRNPNVDDYGKVRAKDDLVTVPNEDIAPEYSYNGEIGIIGIVEGYMKIEVVGFYSYLKDAIVRTNYQLNGRDSLYYDGDYYRITTNYNAGQAYIYGASLNFTSNLNRNIILKGTLNHTRGHNITDDVPMGHIPPLFGRTSLTYRNRLFFLESYVVYQGWKHAADFSPFGEDNEEESMEYGFPSWWTANLKAGFSAGQYLHLMLAVENLFDQFYKPFASGVSAPGINFILTARFTL